MHSNVIFSVTSLLRSTYWSSDDLFGPSFFSDFICFLLVSLWALVLEKFIISEIAHLPAKEQINTLQPSNHIVSCTPSTKTDSLAKWAKPIFIESIFIVLSDAILTEFSITNIFIIDFCIVLEAISFPDHKSLGFGILNYIKKTFTFANLDDVGVTIRCRLDWDSHTIWGILAFYQKVIRVKEFTMMANIKFFKRFSNLERIMASFLYLFKHIFVLILAWLISPEIDFPKS